MQAEEVVSADYDYDRAVYDFDDGWYNVNVDYHYVHDDYDHDGSTDHYDNCPADWRYASLAWQC